MAAHSPDDGATLPDPSEVDPTPAPADARHPWRRFVAMGDSITEGIGDPDPDVPGGNRGWADRLAEELARDIPDFSYANLAIRGRLHGQVIDEQLEPALALEPDLVSFVCGGNDVLRLADPDEVAADMDEAVGKIAATGATVILATGPDIGATPVLSLIRGRAAIFNENIRTVAARHGGVVVDLWGLRQLTHEAMWAEDRLHFSALGHHTIAVAALDALGVPHDVREPQPLAPHPRTWRAARREDLEWARRHFGPWMMRRLRHQSSGDGLAPKRPEAAAVFGHPMPPGSAAAEHE